MEKTLGNARGITRRTGGESDWIKLSRQKRIKSCTERLKTSTEEVTEADECKMS